MKKCIENKVAFVPGNTFMDDQNEYSSSFRLNYSTMSEEKIIMGVKILGKVLEEVLNN
jgi:2-aminoadipate transaminase